MPKTRNGKRRNPIAYDLAASPKYRKRVNDTDSQSKHHTDEKKGSWSRDAKHKGHKLDEGYEPPHWARKIKVDTKSKEIISRETGTVLATYELERETRWNVGLRKRHTQLSGRIILHVGIGATHTVADWQEAADILVPDKPTSLAEFYQVGDKVDITKDGKLKELLAKVKKKDKKKDATIREPNGPANTVGITIDGEFHLIDEDDIKLITEGFDYDDLTEWSMVPTKSGISIPISSEEQEIIEKSKSKVYKNTFDEREQEVARKMVSKGVLTRGRDDKGIYFTSGVPKLTRS